VSPHRVLQLVVAVACLAPVPVAADWIVSPYLGARFGGSSTFLVGGEAVERSKFTFGASAGVLTDGVFGVEADLAFIPGFFRRFEGFVTQSNRVVTLMGNVIVAVPLHVTQYGLRPYAVGGVGLMQARGQADLLGDVISSDLFAMNFGGGAIGPISPRSSLRFDLRYFRNLSGDADAATTANDGLELNFWRGTVGLTFRF
jgi:Outer membrane protein beta-barrel domain